MDPDFNGGFSDPAAAPVPDATHEPAPDAGQVPPATGAPPEAPPFPDPQPAQAPEPAQPVQPAQPQIDPAQFEYYRQRAEAAEQAEWERQQQQVEHQRQWRLRQADLIVEQRSQQAAKRAQEIAQYDQAEAFRHIQETEAQNRQFLRQTRQALAQDFEQRMEADRRALAAPQYARDLVAAWQLPAEYADALAQLPVEQIYPAAIPLYYAHQQNLQLQQQAQAAQRQAQAQRLAASPATRAPAAAGGTPSQAPPDGSNAQLRAALFAQFPDLYQPRGQQ